MTFFCKPHWLSLQKDSADIMKQHPEAFKAHRSNFYASEVCSLAAICYNGRVILSMNGDVEACRSPREIFMRYWEWERVLPMLK